MIEQEPQRADMCGCILEQIRIPLSAQEMRVGPGGFLVQLAEEVPRSAWPHLFSARKPVWWREEHDAQVEKGPTPLGVFFWVFLVALSPRIA